MNIAPLQVLQVRDVMRLMELGEPYVRPRTESDYWLYASLFSSTCPVATANGAVAGAVIAFRSQDTPEDVYIQDVMVHPDHRRQGLAHALIDFVRGQAIRWGCERLYLTSEPDNRGAQATWESLEFRNVPGTLTIDGTSVIADFKGPGKHRAVYELRLRRSPPR